MIWVEKRNYGFIEGCSMGLDLSKDAMFFDITAVLRRKKIRDFRLEIQCLEIKICWICGRLINNWGSVINRNLIGVKNL